MKKLFVFGLAGMFAIGAMAQDDKNLITNPSFESSGKGKLKKLKQISVAADWNSPTGLKADLYSTEAPMPCSAPDNTVGREHPMDGKRYAGIVAYSYNNKQPRTYIQTQLLGPLKKDVEYCVKFHVSLSDLSKYAVNNLGMYVSKDPLEIEAKTDIIFEKQKEFARVVHDPENKIFNGRYNWEPVCGVFKATGKEEYITIGNFYNNKDTKFQKLKKKADFKGTQIPTAYYYIDQVEVFIMDDPSECDCSNTMKTNETTSTVYHKNYTSEDGFSVEEQIKLATVYFDNMKTDLEEAMLKDMDNMAAIMVANPEFKIELIGHTDKSEIEAAKKDPENEAYKDIANGRSEKVKAYLVDKGIDASRITIKKQDISQSSSQGESSLDKAKNRRVEFKLLD